MLSLQAILLTNWKFLSTFGEKKIIIYLNCHKAWKGGGEKERTCLPFFDQPKILKNMGCFSFDTQFWVFKQNC